MITGIIVITFMVLFLYIIPMVVNFMYYFVLVTRYKGLTVERLLRAAWCTFIPIANWLLSWETIFQDIPQNENDLEKRGFYTFYGDESSWIRYYPQELRFFRVLYGMYNVLKRFLNKELIRNYVIK